MRWNDESKRGCLEYGFLEGPVAKKQPRPQSGRGAPQDLTLFAGQDDLTHGIQIGDFSQGLDIDTNRRTRSSDSDHTSCVTEAEVDVRRVCDEHRLAVLGRSKSQGVRGVPHNAPQQKADAGMCGEVAVSILNVHEAHQAAGFLAIEHRRSLLEAERAQSFGALVMRGMYCR